MKKKTINILSFAFFGGVPVSWKSIPRIWQKYKVMKIWMKSCWARDICLMPV